MNSTGGTALWHDEAKRMFADGVSALVIARRFGVTDASVYAAINKERNRLMSMDARRKPTLPVLKCLSSNA